MVVPKARDLSRASSAMVLMVVVMACLAVARAQYSSANCTDSALYFVQTGTHGKIVTEQAGDEVVLTIIMKGAAETMTWFADSPTYKAGVVDWSRWVAEYLNTNYNTTVPMNAAIVFNNVYTDNKLDDQTVVVSISSGEVRPSGVVLFTAKLLSDGDPDGSTAKLLSNMRTGAKREFPMDMPKLFADGVNWSEALSIGVKVGELIIQKVLPAGTAIACDAIKPFVESAWPETTPYFDIGCLTADILGILPSTP